MREITVTNTSVESAIEEAIKQLNTSKSDVDIHVIDEGKKGLFGLFGGKPAIVRVTIKKNPIDEVKQYVQDLLNQMNIKSDVEVIQNGRDTIIRVEGDDAPALIGRRGQTLNALQYIIQLVANKKLPSYTAITLDVGNYREQRKDTLIQLANRLADRSVATKRRVELEPMPAYERKIIHTSLSERKDIKTESLGDEPNRYLVIHPLKR